MCWVGLERKKCVPLGAARGKCGTRWSSSKSDCYPREGATNAMRLRDMICGGA